MRIEQVGPGQWHLRIGQTLVAAIRQKGDEYVVTGTLRRFSALEDAVAYVSNDDRY